MGTCLVTTLKDSVSDNSLMKLGDMVVHFYANTVVRRIDVHFASNATLTIIGNGYFTDASGSTNLGKTINVSNQFTRVYASQGEYDMVISDKYALLVWAVYDVNNANDFSLATGIDIDEFAYSDKITYIATQSNYGKGDLSSVAQKTGLTHLLLVKTAGKDLVTGNIDAFTGSTKLTVLSLTNRTNVRGNISSLSGNINTLVSLQLANTTVNGNISALSGFTNLTTLSLANTGVTGNLSSLGNLTNLKVLSLSGTAITGDTSDLSNLTKLTAFNYANTAITGTWPLT